MCEWEGRKKQLRWGREPWKGWTEAWIALSLLLPKCLRDFHLLAALKVTAPFAKLVMLTRIFHFWISHNLEMPIYFNLLFLFEWENPLSSGRGVSSWTELAGGMAAWLPRKNNGKWHILGQWPGRRIGWGCKEKSCGWEGLKKKKGKKNKGDLNVFIGLCIKPTV